MKSYRALALKEIKAQKMTFTLILIAIVLSTMMTAVIGQSAGVLSAMRQQQAITSGRCCRNLSYNLPTKGRPVAGSTYGNSVTGGCAATPWS